MFMYVAIVLITLLMVSSVGAQFEIVLLNRSVNATPLNNYTDYSLFSNRYTNIRSIDGFIHQPEPRNACSYIEPLSPSFFVNSTRWFALVEDYPSCPNSMVENVRNAGYSLILTSNVNDSSPNIHQNISNTEFPVAIIDNQYALYLRENTLSISLSQAEVYVLISATLTLSILTVALAYVMGCVCCCIGCFCCCAICCYKLTADADDVLANQGHQRNYEQQQHQERVARQELLESILRQLQELQIDLHLQVPLGRDETNKLPIKPYFKGEKNNCDSCAICVDEFREGESLRWLPCEHSFHPQCIDEWLTNHSALCPLCKTEVPGGNQGQARPHPVGARLAGIPIPEMVISTSPSLSTLESDEPLIHSARAHSANGYSRHYGST